MNTVGRTRKALHSLNDAPLVSHKEQLSDEVIIVHPFPLALALPRSLPRSPSPRLEPGVAHELVDLRGRESRGCLGLVEEMPDQLGSDGSVAVLVKHLEHRGKILAAVLGRVHVLATCREKGWKVKLPRGVAPLAVLLHVLEMVLSQQALCGAKA